MTLGAIKELPVADLAARNARLFLWVAPSHYREGVGAQVARAWGFRPVAEFIWEKPNLGMGAVPRICHEFLLVGVRGQADWPKDQLGIRSVQRWTQTYATNGKAHSAKPPAALDLVEQVSPAPYVELFARQPRLGWDSWGHGYEQATG